MSRFFVDQKPSPWGDLQIVTDGDGALWRLTFASGRRPIDLQPTAGLGGEVTVDSRQTRHVCQQLRDYFAGRRRSFDLELKAVGSPFQRQVWRRLQRIPCGETRSYAELANDLGRPSAARAVGRANALNPIAIVVPCHRLVGSNGSLTGFAGGLDFKAGLLALEKRLVAN